MWISAFRTRDRLSPRTKRRAALAAVLLLACGEAAYAEILNSNTNFIRIRLGDNSLGGTSTVIYEPQIPASMSGLTGVTAQPETASTNNIGGGSGVFTVRVVTDLNAKNGVVPIQGTFSYDSSQPMQCITPASCDTNTVPFTRIRWNVRDTDTHTSVTQYDGTANQVIQVQTDTDGASRTTNTRHRNHFQFIFDNAELLPAGTYEGTITMNGVGRF